MTVDGSVSVRQMVRLTLADEGYAIVEAADGADALAKLASTPVDLVITDLDLPDLDGVDLIREIRANPGYRSTPVIVLAAQPQDDRRREGRAAGATGFVTKPFRPDQLVAMVRQVLP